MLGFQKGYLHKALQLHKSCFLPKLVTFDLVFQDNKGVSL